MPKSISFADVNLEVSPSTAEKAFLPDPETPFRVLLMGDFSGRTGRAVAGAALPVSKPLLIDRDNFDEVVARLKPELRLQFPGGNLPPVLISFSEPEDFHPDRIFQRLPLFQMLRDTRRKLEDPSTFAETAALLRPTAEVRPRPPQPPPAPERPPQPPPIPTGAGLLDDILAQTERAPLERAPSRDDLAWESFLRDLVAPYASPSPDPRQAELVAQVDTTIASQMRAVLHHPAFQALEAAWRAVFFLIRELETGTYLKLYLLDLSRDELAADLLPAEDLASTRTYRLWVEEAVETPGGEPWAVLAGDYTFSDAPEDVKLLGQIAKLARRAGAPFLAEAGPAVLGCRSLAETPYPHEWSLPQPPERVQAWEALRRLPEASSLGLVVPRFLLRLPYGRQTSPIEEFSFEEMPEPPEHERYLWGNPAFACIYLLAQAFTQQGWGFWPGAVGDIDGLPAHVYKEDGESRMKPCAEALLTEKAAMAILEKGPMVLLSIKDRNQVRLLRFQSITEPAAPLYSRWQS